MSKLLFACLLPLLFCFHDRTFIPDSKRAADIRTKVWPKLQQGLKGKGLGDDQPIYIRIIKETNLLQIWIQSGSQYKLFNSYDICYYSGGMGTKTKDGDNKSPEGCYSIKPTQLNPVSNYHLSINVGYPNALEKQLHDSGKDIMIHGSCASIGCYAMTDPGIDEIYTMVYEAFLHGQKSIELHILPFKMDDAHLKTYAASPNMPFWKKLKKGYDLFEKTHLPPVVTVVHKSYAFAEGK